MEVPVIVGAVGEGGGREERGDRKEEGEGQVL